MSKSILHCLGPLLSLLSVSLVFVLPLIPAGCAVMPAESRRQADYHEFREARHKSFEQWSEPWKSDEDRHRPLLTGAMTLDEVLEAALLHNKQISAVLRERAVAEGSIVEAYAGALPRLTASADYTRLAETPGLGLPGFGQIPGLEELPLPDIGDSPRNRYSTGLRLAQPLFRGGAITSSIRTSRLGSLMIDETIRATVQGVVFEAGKAYYDLLLAQHLLEVNRDAVTSAKAHLESVRERRRQGMATEFDVLRAKVDVSLFQAEMISQQNKIHLATTELLRIMGVSQDSEIELADQLEYSRRTVDYQEELGIAMESRPDLFMAELQIRMQRESLVRARSGYWPEINAWFDYEYSRPDPVQTGRDQWGDTWRGGLSLSMPLFDGWRREGRIKQEENRLEKDRIELKATEERVMQQVRQGVLSLGNAEEFVASQELNLERAAKALQLAEAGYREGVTDSVAVTEARAALTRARGLYYEAVHSHTVALLNLKRVTGILEPLPELPPVEPWRW